LSQYTRVTDRQTDRQTEFSSQYRVCITCSAVKISISFYFLASLVGRYQGKADVYDAVDWTEVVM